MFSLEYVLGHHVVCGLVCSQLDTYSLTRLNLVSKSISGAVQAYCRARWNVNRHLGQFFRNPEGFRKCMREAKAVISGSNVLEWLEGRRFGGSYLDVYVWDIDDLFKMGSYLVRAEGYVFCPRADVRPQRSWEGFFAEVVWEGSDADGPKVIVLEFECRGETVQVIYEKILAARANVPKLASLGGLDRTSAMNFYTADALYSLFPLLTFGCRESIVTRRRVETVEEALRYKEMDRKEDQRGLRIRHAPDAREFLEFSSVEAVLRRSRTLHDKYTFMRRFGQKSDGDALDTVKFRLAVDKGQLRVDLAV